MGRERGESLELRPSMPGARWRRARIGTPLCFHHTAAATILDERWRYQALRAEPANRDGASEARCFAISVARCPPKRARRGETVGSPSETGSEAGDGNPTRQGCSSLKTWNLDCTRRPEHAVRHRCARGERSGSGMKCGMRQWIHVKAHPTRDLDEPKVEVSGTARVVAESNHDGLLNPNHRCDSVRRKSVGRPARTSVARDFHIESYDGRARDVSVKAPPASPTARAGG